MYVYGGFLAPDAVRPGLAILAWLALAAGALTLLLGEPPTTSVIAIIIISSSSINISVSISIGVMIMISTISII